MITFNKKAAEELVDALKSAFVPMPGGQPAAGAGPMTAGMANPMDPAMGGVPPEGAPMDPAMGGMPPDGAPMDPAMGGMPPEAMMDPAMGGMPPGGEPPLPPELEALLAGGGEGAPGQISMSVPEFLELIRTLRGDAGAGAGVSAEGGEVAKPEKPKKVSTEELNSKLDALLAALGGGAPPPVAGGM